MIGSPEGKLGANAEAALADARKKLPKVETKELTPEEIRAKAEREKYLKDLTREWVDASFTIPVIATGDTRWREYLSDEKFESLSTRWLMFCKAWGIEMAGPISATIAVGLGYATTFGAIYRKIQMEDEAIPDEQHERTTETPDRSS